MSSASTAPPRPGRFLPPDPRVEEPYRLTPQLALRIGILGMIVLAVFALLFLRLWALQVLSGNQYLNAAQNNQLRTVRLQAPRGPIVDRYGEVLVGNVAGNSVQIWPADLPKNWPAQRAVLRRLSRFLDVPVRSMLRQIEERKNDPLTPVTVKRGIHDDEVFYLAEHAREFPGVAVARTYLRDYPYKALAAHMLGHVGEISPAQLKERRRLKPGDEVGQGGVEAAFDQYLRGRPGAAQLRVDSRGRPRGTLVPTLQSRPGHALRLTIDRRLQQAAERALVYGIQTAIANDDWYANGGAIVALDPRDGQVLAMASNPTFRPSVYVGRIDRRKLRPLLDPRVAVEYNHPALNRATAGTYPPGSTFKPVTALAALEEGVLSAYEYVPCTPAYDRYEQVFSNWTWKYNQGMALPQAIATSCDTYFYELGNRFYRLPEERGHPLQMWASRFGFGAPTGIDIGSEDTGLLPTPEWRQKTFKTKIDRTWKPGYSIMMAIGQGDLAVTPLQMTRFYALVANGGKLVTPYVVANVEQPGERGERSLPLRRFAPPAPQPSGVSPYALRVVQDGLYRATHWPDGTSAGVFHSFPVPIAGKTGTAEKRSQEYGRYLNQSWWCGYAPASAPTIVVCAVIENGGHGGSAAAPAALKVFEAYFRRSGGPIGPMETD